HLAQVGHAARQLVDVRQGEVHFSFLGGGQQVQDGVGGATHGDVQGHGVLEGLEAGDRARQHAGVVLFVVALGDLDDGTAGLQEEFLAVAVGGQHGAVAGQAEADGLHQAVHRVGGEHAGAGSAGGAGGPFDLVHFGVAVLVVGGGHHGVHQVELDELVGETRLAGLHRPAGDEHGRD